MKHDVEFANFTATAGDKVLVDLLENFIIPAFSNPYIRNSRFGTSYLFSDIGIKIIRRRDKRELVVFGRMIKKMHLERDQIYVGGEIVKDHQEMDSAPSSIFVLTLSDHKIIYFRETANAPGLEAFQNTIRAFVKLARMDFIRQQFDAAKNGEELDESMYDPKLKRVTKKHLMAVIKQVVIDVIPLPSQKTLSNFINSFQTINSIESKFIATNHETDFSGFVEQVRAETDKLNADQTTLRFVAKEGLNKKEAGEQITALASQGNAIVKVEGIGRSGETIKGNNDNFKVSIATDTDSFGSPNNAAAGLVDAYDTLVEQDVLHPAKVSTPTQKVIDIIEKFVQLINTGS